MQKLDAALRQILDKAQIHVNACGPHSNPVIAEILRTAKGALAVDRPSQDRKPDAWAAKNAEGYHYIGEHRAMVNDHINDAVSTDEGRALGPWRLVSMFEETPPAPDRSSNGLLPVGTLAWALITPTGNIRYWSRDRKAVEAHHAKCPNEKLVPIIGACDRPSPAPVAYMVRRYCKGDGEWTNWRPESVAFYERNKDDSSFEFRALTFGESDRSSNGLLPVGTLAWALITPTGNIRYWSRDRKAVEAHHAKCPNEKLVPIIGACDRPSEENQ